jgi:antitoxin (DNA-binding transcriptional repressor) of toxin-antitoxin stability system
MKTHQRILAILVTAALSGMMQSARADEAAALAHEILVMDANATTAGSGAVTGKIAADFQSFAGSKTNATALVTGLREGSEITLTKHGHPPATFTPPTARMGYGNVSTSLGLAQYQLAQQGISNPTPQQLKIALTGGTIVRNGQPVVYDGILQMRADGLGWGQIAQQLGTKLGPVVSGIKSQNTSIATAQRPVPPTTAATSTATSLHGSNSQSAGKGIVNAGGNAAQGAAKGKDDAGVSSAAGRSSPPGRGIVSASGQAVGAGAQNSSSGHGASGAVTSSGASAGGTASATGNGQGKALGHTK